MPRPHACKISPKRFLLSQGKSPFKLNYLEINSLSKFVPKVRTWKMHLFTASQALGLSILWIVKSTSAALAFPFFVVGMVPLRLVLRFFFTPKELDAVSVKI
jgi:hypothetical protein